MLSFAFLGEQRHISPMSSVDVKQILKLSVPERIELVEAIWDSIADAPERLGLPVTAAQKRELDRRLAEYQKNPGAGRTWEEVRDSLDETE
jgi:putative addiction module component (TIGR02574 family)